MSTKRCERGGGETVVVVVSTGCGRVTGVVAGGAVEGATRGLVVGVVTRGGGGGGADARSFMN